MPGFPPALRMIQTRSHVKTVVVNVSQPFWTELFIIKRTSIRPDPLIDVLRGPISTNPKPGDIIISFNRQDNKSRASQIFTILRLVAEESAVQ